METKVVNRHLDRYDIYIGRGSIWGNPFFVSEYGRHGAIVEYEKYLREAYAKEPEKFIFELTKLKGKVLGCHCKPRECHGDVLVKLIKELGV